MNYNKVILAGRLTRDPEIRYTHANVAACKLGLAVNDRWKDSQTGEWKERATFVDVTIWGKRGEAFEKFHKSGDDAFLEGKLRMDEWDDRQTGKKRKKLYMVADSWEFAGARKEPEREKTPLEEDCDDVPF